MLRRVENCSTETMDLRRGASNSNCKRVGAPRDGPTPAVRRPPMLKGFVDERHACGVVGDELRLFCVFARSSQSLKERLNQFSRFQE